MSAPAAIDNALQNISASAMIHRTSTLITTGSRFVSFIDLFQPALDSDTDLASAVLSGKPTHYPCITTQAIGFGPLSLQNKRPFHNYGMTHHSAEEAVSISGV